MPFGLQNAPAMWQRFVEQMLGYNFKKFVFVYLVDIIVCTSTFSQHLHVLNRVLERITATRLN